MGLSVHYSIKSTATNAHEARDRVEAMRQLVLDLPFEEVDEVTSLQGKECHFEERRKELQNGEEKNESLFWLLIQACEYVRCPWNPRLSRTVYPERIIAFSTWPGQGCETANFGLCLYPEEIDWEYKPQDDKKWQHKGTDGWWEFDWSKWRRHVKRAKLPYQSPSMYAVERKVATKLKGWQWRSCCKTQYASDPAEGGVPNFLKCHISLITALERMNKLYGLRVSISDEGDYGPGTLCLDYAEAHAAGRKPKYRRHKGKHNVAELVKEIGEWNNFIAAMAGSLKEAMGGKGFELEAPIFGYQNFEQLEFKGHQRKDLQVFLKAMDEASKNQRATAGKDQA